MSDKPEYKPGDVVNVWRLTARDGWVPVAVRRWDSTSKIIMGGVAVFILLVIVMGAISNTSDDGSSTSDDPAVTKYEQTWHKGYSSTTCAEWHSDMSASQRFAAAADMLAGARNEGDGGAGLPPDSLISTFEGDISEACVIPAMSIAEVVPVST